jgi:uncharacterized membrane protein YkoI
MTRMKKALIGLATLAALGAGGATVAGATGSGGDQTDPKPAPAAAARAERAALAATGGVRANAVELDNEKGATYEVEVAKPDGSTVDVRLGDAFQVIAVDPDSEG